MLRGVLCPEASLRLAWRPFSRILRLRSRFARAPSGDATCPARAPSGDATCPAQFAGWSLPKGWQLWLFFLIPNWR